MAHWSSNFLWIVGGRDQLDEFAKEACGRVPAYEGKDGDSDELGYLPLSLGALVPMTCEKREEGEGEDIIKWRRENWGTEWDIDDCDFEDKGNQLFYFYYILDRPPFEWFQKVSNLYPSLSFRVLHRSLNYAVEGQLRVENGVEVFHYWRNNVDTDYLSNDKSSYERVVVGDERRDWEPPSELPCRECGAEFMQFHTWGCKREPCPICWGQLAECGCEYKRHYAA